jgi:hypothetical protein
LFLAEERPMIAQLDNDDWIDRVRDALRNWHSPDLLEKNDLAGLGLVERQSQKDIYLGGAYRRGRALRDVLKAAIATLGVAGEMPPSADTSADPRWMDHRWRHHNILTLSQNLPVGDVAARVGLALAGQFYREQKRAFATLAEVLRSQEGGPIAAASTAALAYPSGAVKLDDPFYIERASDVELAEALKTPGATITIRGPRQVGKTSLLTRGIYHGRRQFNPRVIYYDQQGADEADTQNLDTFLHSLALHFFDELDLDLATVAPAWDSQLQPQRKLSKLIERHILASDDRPVLLAMDEIDRLQFTPFSDEFFGLLRSWHNRRASHPLWNKLTIIMAISTEPYLLIDNLNQSPFNVGQILYLRDFSGAQVADLNTRYGAPVGAEEVPEITSLLGGHPYLTRVALYTMVVDRLTWRDLAAVSAADNGPFHQHLQLQYRLTAGDDRLRNALGVIMQTNRCSDEHAGFRLMKAGLVNRLDDGAYECRCELYRRYFSARL